MSSPHSVVVTHSVSPSGLLTAAVSWTTGVTLHGQPRHIADIHTTIGRNISEIL